MTTLYQSEKTIQSFYQRLVDAVRELTNDYEIIFVNDGSPDDSLSLAVEIAKKDFHCKVVNLSRNFGHHKALMTGLKYTKGDRVLLIDSDLEENPEYLIDFDRVMNETASDVVYGVQKARKGGWFERVSGKFYYQLMRWFLGVKLPKNMTTIRLMSRAYVNAVLDYREDSFFIFGIFHITGFKQTPFAVEKLSTSPSSYTLKRKLSLAIDSIVSFSDRPLVYIFYLGLLVSFASLLLLAFIIIRALFFGHAVEGWASLIASIWACFGLLILVVGILGVYMSKIFLETKKRPFVLIKDVFQFDKKDEF